MTAASALRTLLYAMTALGVFLAFGWPYLVSDDPRDPAFRLAALAALLAFFASLLGCCLMRLRARAA